MIPNESSAGEIFIALNAFINKLMRSHASFLTVHLEALEYKEASILRSSRWEEIINLKPEINKLKTKSTIQRLNEAKNCFVFLRKINKIDKSPAKLTERQREYPN